MNIDNMGEQVQDVNMEDPSKETASGPIDVAPEAHDGATETPNAPSTISKVEDNNGSEAKDDSANKLDKDEQSNSINNSTDPVTEVEDDGIDYFDGTYGAAPENPPPDVQITRLQNEKTNLKHRIDVLENQVAILKGDGRRRAAEFQNLISTQHTAITNANNRITAQHTALAIAENNNAGKQRQLDSLYATLTRQGQQFAAQAAQINAQIAQINAQAAHINTLKHQHGNKLYRIRNQMEKMVKLAVPRFERHALTNATAIRRFGDDVEWLLTEGIADPEATESEEEGDVEEEQGVEEQEMVVIDLSDDEDEDQVGGEVQSAAAAVAGEYDTVQQFAVGEQRVIAGEAVASEESPSKRVKLTHQV
jgi:hypothetical protein